MERGAVLAEVAARLVSRDVDHPLRVGIDGICGVGKTTFARDLADHVDLLGRPVIELDSDGFHHPRAIRYRQGRESARGYYEDGYDFDSLRDLTLVPLGPDGSRRYASRIHDLRNDATARTWASAPADAIVVFAATFLQRDQLRQHWDEVIFLDADIDQAQGRGVARDAAALGGPAATETAYKTRYMAACKIYLAEQRPRSRASIVIDHNDPLNPTPL